MTSFVAPFTAAPVADQFTRFIGCWTTAVDVTADGCTVLTLRPVGRGSCRYLMFGPGVAVTELKDGCALLKQIERAKQQGAVA